MSISRRSLRSDKDVQMLQLDNTPRKSSRTPSKLNLLQNTPDRNDQSFTEIERHTPRPFRSRKSQEVETDLRTHDLPVETNNNSLLNSSTVMNNSRFDPQHLYGLDNPETSSPDTKEGNSIPEDARREKSVVYKVGKEIITKLNCYWICFGFSIFMWLSLIGWMITLNTLLHDKLSASPEKLGKEELGLKQLGERISKLEKSSKLCNAQGFPKVFLNDKAVKGSSEDLLNLITMRIEQALQRWDADKIGIPDYALESAGGQIHSAYHSPTFSSGAPQLLVFGIPLWYEVKTPRVIIQPGNVPGRCWAFHGREGYVAIKLSQIIKPSSFSLEHMSASLSQFGDNSIPSAPKDFTVWGWGDAHGKDKTKLGEYVYDHEGTALQNFPVQVSPVSNFRFVELRVHSNYGNPSYTCLYRFRVHGEPYKNNNNEN
ncbi:PREDICTED: sperm-associated antigen 4 protein-like isoform X1 [Acropora digitifera]|uniref:sperm-associated antigen 4 protein-like isoform X1 n=2 Tax=Acropora digitifera TaxID=70779 RepID=UPI00077AB85E|nr:PREDICTED: sperm-associated antigen 4 protein-like isoform X1 [Acropora digitifera]